MSVLVVSFTALMITRFEMRAPASTSDGPSNSAAGLIKNSPSTGHVVKPTSTLPGNDALKGETNNAISLAVPIPGGIAHRTDLQKSKKQDDQISALVAKDLNIEFKAQPLIGKTQIDMEDDLPALAEILAPNHNSGDRALRLKSSILDERLLSGLSQVGLGAIAELYQGPLFNMHSSGLSDKWVDLEERGISTWGYLRMPSDTSKSYEIKKYLIELELMQTR
jgi:hypothetical protein